jgi:TolB-like protein/Tfp pilus assembly protein PilF
LIRRRRRIAATAGVVAAVVILALLALRFLPILQGHSETLDTIAVLPFANLTGDPEQEVFADGMTGELITSFGRLSGLRKVIARASVMQFKGSDKLPGEIARVLGVKALVTGTLQEQGEQLRFTAELIEARTEQLLWSDSFEGPRTDILIIQNEIAKAIAGEIDLTLTPSEEARLAMTPKVDPVVYQAYVWALENAPLFGRAERVYKAIGFLEQAIEIDSSFAPAYAELAGDYAFLCRWWGLDTACRRARANALKALEIDSLLAEAHSAIAKVHLNVDLDWEQSRLAHERAVALSPNSVIALGGYGEYLMWAGESDKSIAIMKRALELNPQSIPFNIRLGFTYIVARRYEDAIQHFHHVRSTLGGKMDSLEIRVLETELSWAHRHIGDFERAQALEAKLGDDHPTRLYAAMGRREEALQGFAEWPENATGWYQRAIVYSLLGEIDTALDLLERTYEEYPRVLLQVNSDPELDALRPHPRFRALMRRAGIPMGQLAVMAE